MQFFREINFTKIFFRENDFTKLPDNKKTVLVDQDFAKYNILTSSPCDLMTRYKNRYILLYWDLGYWLHSIMPSLLLLLK